MNSSGRAIPIPQRFSEEVALHLVRHMIPLPRARPPLILGIQGPSGEGKTYQCDLLLDRMGVHVVKISGNELESESAGEPGRIISSRYEEASQLLVTRRAPMALLFINDLDLGIGRWGTNVTYTVNTQNAVATLMHLADYRPEDLRAPRAPIVITGNDFSTVYRPLARFGRMRQFHWVPTLSEKMDVVHGLFHDLGLTREATDALVNDFKGQSVAFFAEIKARLHDVTLRELIREVGTLNVAKHFSVPANRQARPLRPGCDITQVRDVALALLESAGREGPAGTMEARP